MGPQKVVTKATCPALPDFVLLTDAARSLGVSRQYIHRIADAGRFQSLHHLGDGTVYVVSAKEVQAMVTGREHRAEEDAAQEADD